MPETLSSMPETLTSIPERLTDTPLVQRWPWFTPKAVIFGTLEWMILFSLGSIAISNPFASETSASAPINYWHVMYLHGLLVGMVGITLLLVVAAHELRWRHVWFFVTGGVVVATVLDALGGIFDRRVPGAEAAMWTQVAGFFVLDEMLIVTVIAFFIGWRQHQDASRRLSFFVAWFATFSLLVAAAMGHIAGWITEYGAHPHFIVSFASFVGEKVTDLQTNLVGSHSHEMTVAFMALVIASAVAVFAERRPTPRDRQIRRLGLGMALAGTVIFTGVYTYAGFTTWTIPTWFTSAHGANGIASDDIFTGLVMAGGALALVATVIGRSIRPLLTMAAAAWSWTLTVGLVVATGYWITLHEVTFGAGSPAPAAPADAVYTWFHQDIGLFLFPLMTVLLVVTGLYVVPRRQDATAITAILGSSLLFIGAWCTSC